MIRDLMGSISLSRAIAYALIAGLVASFSALGYCIWRLYQ